MKLPSLLLFGAAAAFLTPAPFFAQTGGNSPAAVAGAEKNTTHTWLGLSTWPLDPSVAKQLKLTPGFHLSVVEVAPDSPAAQAGLQADDILLRIDDQILVNPPQLRTLIRSHSPGEKIRLTFLRGGTQKSVEIALGTRTYTENEQNVGSALGSNELIEMLSRSSNLPDIQEHVRMLPLELQVDDNGNTPASATVSRTDVAGSINLTRTETGTRLSCTDPSGKTVFEGPINTPEQRAQVPAEWLRKADQLGAGLKVTPSAPIRRRVILPEGGSQSVSMQSSDEQGTAVMTVSNGNKVLVCTDPQGRVVFNGPVNTPEERSRIPAEWLTKADKLSNPLIQSGSGRGTSRKPTVLPTPGPRVSVLSETTAEGSLTLREENGMKTLRATDTAGAVLFDGPVTTSEDRAKVPPEVLSRSEALERREKNRSPDMPPEPPAVK